GPVADDLMTHLVADLAVGRDRGGDGDDAVPSQELGHVADAADVGVAVLLREAEPLREVRPDLVTVEDLGALAGVAQPAGDLERQRALAGAGEAGEPDDEAAGVF